jgi:hypothetical protein
MRRALLVFDKRNTSCLEFEGVVSSGNFRLKIARMNGVRTSLKFGWWFLEVLKT